jgi:tRNA A37 methylthiotransferase MiaB
MSSTDVPQSYLKSGANVFLESLSCTRRDLDTQKISTYLHENNYTIVHDPSKADYIIIMTCGTTKDLANISLKSIEKFKKFNAEMIVAGCLPETHDSELRKIFTGKILSTKNLDTIDKFLPSVKKKFSEIPDANTRWDNQNDQTLKGVLRRIHAHMDLIKRVDWFLLNTGMKVVGKNIVHVSPFNRLLPQPGQCYISISRGCIYNCTYCVIKKGVGPLHSKPPQQCIEELICGLQQGYHSFYLEAEDSGPYGVDIGSSLPQLLRKMMDIQGTFTVKLSHTHPEWLIKYKAEFTEIFKQKKVNNILAPIQSGSDRILQLMARPYPIKEVVSALQAFKDADSGLSIGVDLIVGFPSETEEDFQGTLRLFNKIHFDYGILIPFSNNEGTKASSIEPKIPKQVVDQRMKTALRYLRKQNYVAWRFRNSALIFYAR